jgi:ABC-type Fe3+/spermidine/putrescine transport system ATPase subunit
VARHDALTSQGISKHYGSLQALQDVNLIWESGKITSILGPSGSGKTTLGEIFAGLVRPDEGRIMIGHEDTTDWKPNRRKISLMPQEWELFQHLTVLENVGFGLWASGVARKARDERARALLLTLGLADREQAFPQELSGGQQQRVALARALAAPNPLVVLDEPFSSVDQDTRGLLRILLTEESRQGRGILLITHDRADALMLSNTIHCLISGRLVMSGTPQQLYCTPVSLQAALLTGAAFLVPLSSNGITMTSSTGIAAGLRQIQLPLRRSRSSQELQFDDGASAIVRPEWLEIARNGEFHLAGNVNSSSYSGGYYVVTLKGVSNAFYQAHLDQDIPIGTSVPLCVKQGIELPVISNN